MIRVAFAFLALFAATACAPMSGPHRADRVAATSPGPLPQIAGYGEAAGRQETPWTRRSLVEDFIELTFDTEWGLRTDRLLKWERPVRVALIGAELRGYGGYAADLVARLDAATGEGLSVTLAAPGDQTPGDQTAEIVFRSAPRAEMRAHAPGALCFFTPFSGDWPAFLEARGAGGASWSDVERLETITVFVPSFAAPYEIRACLEEEAAQALGTSNDLFRLEDSMFNDDAAHLRLTALDALMLRVLYDPALHSGMDRAAAREAARGAFGRARPAFGAARRAAKIDDDVHDEIRGRLYASDSRSERRKWATRLIEEMEARGVRDHRLAEALTGRAILAFRDNEPGAALVDLERAEAVLLAALPPRNVRTAITRASLAAVLKREGRARDALAKLDQAIPVLAANAHDKHLAQALRWRAAALLQLGERAEAKNAARDAVAWGAYVYGRDSEEVGRWRREFAALGQIG